METSFAHELRPQDRLLLWRCNAEGGGDLDLSDAICAASWLFLGGSEPPRPFGPMPGACDLDPTHDDLICDYLKHSASPRILPD